MIVASLFIPEGVTPAYTDSCKYVMTQREAVYEDLLRALQVMRIVDDKTPKPKVLYAMWLLETKQLCLGYDLNVRHYLMIHMA